MGLYIHWQMMKDPIYGQIMYNCWLSNPLNLKLQHKPRILLVAPQRATGKANARLVTQAVKIPLLAMLRLDVLNY